MRSDIEIFDGTLFELDPKAALPVLGLRWHAVQGYDDDSVRVLCIAPDVEPPKGAKPLRGIIVGDRYDGPIRLAARSVEGEAVVVRVVGAVVTVAIVPGVQDDAGFVAAVRGCAA